MLGTEGDPGVYNNVSISPDERRVAVVLQSGTPPNSELWLLDRARAGAPLRFTFDPASDVLPVWSPDGSQIAFGSNRNRTMNIFLKAASRSGQEEPATSSTTTPNYVTDWSHDGRFLAYTNQAAETGLDLWVLPLSGDKAPELFLRTPNNEDNAVFSLNGRWIAYDSDESGRPEVYVRPFHAAGPEYPVSRSGGTQPVWNDDGRELFFLAPDGTLMSASISTAKGFEAAVPKPMFRTEAALTGVASADSRRQYAVAKDGKRFLFKVAEQRRSSVLINVFVNWTAALKEGTR